MSCGKVINWGEKITGPDTPSTTWADNCPADSNVIWPSSGNKDIQVDALGSFPQAIPLETKAVVADLPIWEFEVGSGSDQEIVYYDFFDETPSAEPSDPPQGYREYFTECGTCGGYSRTQQKTRTIRQGQYGQILTPVTWRDNQYSARFFVERAAEILLTDTSGTRGIRCGYAVRVESAAVDMTINSAASAAITDPEGNSVIGGVKIPRTLDFTVKLAAYIKTACDVTSPFGEYNQAITSHAPIELTTSVNREIIPMDAQSFPYDGRWETKQESVHTGRTTSSDCQYGYREYQLANFGAGTIKTLLRVVANYCWFPVITNYSWEEPAPSTETWNQINVAALDTEMQKHADSFWEQVAERYQKEATWQKYPLYGDIPMRLTKRGSTLEFRLTHNPGMQPLRWTDPFVNRILNVSVNDGTTLVGTTVL